jgi:DNA modification methylase
MIDAKEEEIFVTTSSGSAFSSTMREALYQRFKTKISMNPALDRTLVSFQANKRAPFSGWFKYREGFSETLVTYLLQHLQPQPGVLFDPFSGAGSALFAASALGWETIGVEILPVGIYATQARLLARRVHPAEFKAAVDELLHVNFSDYYDERYALKHIAITGGAFPEAEERQLTGYIAYCYNLAINEDIRTLLLFAAFCILEDISYTRKDGQYLRWDARSGRSLGSHPFNKGRIFSFHEAIGDKLQQMATDLAGTPIQQNLFNEAPLPQALGPEPHYYEASCLELLPTMGANTIDFVLTSPPYANRYDYTRTYALELVFLGKKDEEVKQLRQAMLSCTVENRSKRERLQEFYEGQGRKADFQQIEAVFNQQAALHEVLGILEQYRKEGKLNNENISRLVYNYFYEMCFVIYELSRVLKPGSIIAMINDNVRYAGEEVPVDLILSAIAESFGLTTRHIWTLERGKGNSSQQMGNHGRSELRKCVYIWEKGEATAMTADKVDLAIEANRINYRLRSTFFYRKLKEYNTLAFPMMIADLLPVQHLYSWADRTRWGIGDNAFEYISKHPQLKCIQVFCHPKLLREHPRLLAYYRNIAALSQKAVSYLADADVKRYETDVENRYPLSEAQALTLARLFNEHITLIVDSSIQSLTEAELHGLLLTSTGAQIDGSWRNAIGEEAEKVVQRLLVMEAKERGLLSAFIPRVGTSVELYNLQRAEEQLGNLERYRGILLTSKTSILCSSEPDISLISTQGTTLGVIEVKGGADPAGALERLGAAEKSFNEARRHNPKVRTILVASCITDEAEKRIKDDPTTFNKYFNLTAILSDLTKASNKDTAYNQFMREVFSLLENQTLG